MFNLKNLRWLIVCILILSGCATQMEKGELAPSAKTGLTKTFSLQENGVNEIYQMGRNYQNKEQYAEAIQAYEKVLELNPDFFDAYNGIGVVYSILGEHDLAIQLISEAIKLAPKASYLHNNLGFAFLKQGRTSEAAGAFQRALQLDPNNVGARNNLSGAYKKLGCVENEPCGQWQEPIQTQK